MSKKINPYIEIFQIFFSAIKMYFKNFDLFFRNMEFPVFGQVLGLFLIFVPTYYYTKNIDFLTAKFSFFNNVLVVFSILLLITLPGFVVFAKAFWDFLTRYVILNDIAFSLTTTAKKNVDTKMSGDEFSSNTFSFVSLLLLLSIITLVGFFPLLWLFLLLFYIFASFVFQIFTFDIDKNPIHIIKKSFALVKKNFLSVLILLILLYVLTYVIMPDFVCWVIEKANMKDIISRFPVNYMSLMGIKEITELSFSILSNKISYNISIYEIGWFIMQTLLNAIVIGLTLPLRSIAFTLLYKFLDEPAKE